MEDSSLRGARIEKLKKLKALGINPYPVSFDKKQTVADALKSRQRVKSIIMLLRFNY